jgi:acyl-[acyl-carrier-protein] desaturase
MVSTETLSPSRLEVMQYLEPFIEEQIPKFLKTVEQSWQPADLLPDARDENFIDQIKELQERAMELPYDFWAVLIGDTITEEALPTYEAWLVSIEGISEQTNSPWMRWVRAWTAEENRHGDLLNRYLYLSGRIDMKEVEISTQYLISEGFDLQTSGDPYRSFVYTSFQELATNYSHGRVAALAKDADNPGLAKICATIAGDEMRHARAYSAFIKKIFEVDPDEMMLAFADMMKKKIVMPAHFMRESDSQVGQTFDHFSNAAQRLGVYTAMDYVQIMRKLIKQWKVEEIGALSSEAEKAREYLLALPDRLERLAGRLRMPKLDYEFSWIGKRY